MSTPPTNTSPVRFAQLGVIHPHGAGWRDCLSRMPEVEVVAYYDADPAAARERLPEPERARPLYGDIAALLRAERPDAVLVTLPNDVTPQAMVQAAGSGAHVFAEKPCARTAEEFRPAAEALRRAGLQFGTGYLRRLSPLGLSIREWAQAGILGRLTSVEARWITTSVTRRDLTHFIFSRERSGGGMLHWLGCHWLDFMRWSTGSEVAEVAAVLDTLSGEPIDVEDTAALSLRFANGMVGSLHCAYVTDASTDQLYFGLRGTLGWVRWERSGPEVEVHSAHPSWSETPTRVVRVTPDKSAGYGDGTGRDAVRQFIAAFRQGAAPPFTTDDALRVLEVIDAAHESAAAGRRITLPPSRP